jgi:hypothetical protein
MRIRLIGTVNMPPIFGHDGHIIDVTEENQAVAEQLVLVGSAKTLKEADEVIVVVTGPQLEKLSADQLPPGVLAASQGLLHPADPVGKLAEFDVHGRYVKAFQDAGVITIADVIAKGEKLSDIPGISENAAKTIAAVLKDKMEGERGTSVP